MAVMVMITLTACLTGCATRISMNPSSMLELPRQHLPCTIVLFMDQEFHTYRWQKFSAAELSTLSYDLGSASKNIFLEAFKQMSDDLTIVESPPAYPLSGRHRVVLVIEPRISAFDEKHSPFIRNADYRADITYRVTACDKTGKVILEKDYFAQGVAMGSTDVYRNFAAPVEKAMAQAVAAIIEDIRRLVLSQNAGG